MAIRVTFPTLIEYSAILPIALLKHVQEAGRRMAQYAQQATRNYQSVIEENPENAKQTLFTKMFNAGPEGLKLHEIVPEAGGYIVAGSDTTAITLTYLVWAVCRQPIIRDKLVAEVSALPPDFKQDAVRDLPYLNQVIQETLRIHSAVPSALPRAVPPEVASLAGYSVPGGVTVSSQAYTLHRNPNVFPNPHV